MHYFAHSSYTGYFELKSWCDFKFVRYSSSRKHPTLASAAYRKPLILHSVALDSTENPLRIASIAGHIDFVKEILRLKPEFTKELNQDGFSPMHLALANGHLEIVRELLKVDKRLCQLEGREEKNPLHYAATKGKVDVNKEVKREDILNLKDEQGNTILHLATWKKQRQARAFDLRASNWWQPDRLDHKVDGVIELLLGKEATTSLVLDVNAINKSALTARFATDFSKQGRNPSASVTSLVQPKNLVEYFKFKKGRDSPSDARNVLLVISVLVATATFQVGLTPPGGFWQDGSLAGRSILGSNSEVTFLLFRSFQLYWLLSVSFHNQHSHDQLSIAFRASNLYDCNVQICTFFSLFSQEKIRQWEYWIL
uniref:PGG domain-containing protein n=1 Tax=Quercus lobata TaxID=97700 RepID=A0A7N2MIK8_QUELO